ncbi:MAG: helix-turn-helix domain-containing protein [Clostridia bacterium]
MLLYLQGVVCANGESTQERIGYTEYCIAHDGNYKEAAACYEVSYSRVDSWVKKVR